MLSTDKNVETIASLVEQLKEYAGLQAEYLKLGAVEKIVRLVSALVMAAVLSLLVLLLVIFLSFSLAQLLASWTGPALAYLIVALCYLLLFLLAIVFRRRWIERPLVRFLAGLLMENNE